MLTRRLDRKLPAQSCIRATRRRKRILAADMQKRAACFWATPCGRGCSIRANYQSTTVHLPPALDTGNLDIITDAMVRSGHQAQGRQGRGVIYIDKTGEEPA